jgi:nitroreductase
MMEDPVLQRRSIRKYIPDEIEDEILDHIISCGDAAACAKGIRSWHFIVIRNRELLDKVPSFHPYSKMIRQAPAAILVCADPSKEPIEGYWAQNCSAATENILIGARSKGIGSVWLGVYPNNDRIEGIKKLIKIPEGLVPFSIVVLGHPDEEKTPYTGYDPNRVTFIE